MIRPPPRSNPLSLHDALPIYHGHSHKHDHDHGHDHGHKHGDDHGHGEQDPHNVNRHDDRIKAFCMTFEDRKSTRLNSSHQIISYAVFCLKKKQNNSDSSWPTS